MVNKELCPKSVIAEEDGYKMTARYVTSAREFMSSVAQQGDALGTLSLEGPGFKVKVGSKAPLLFRQVWRLWFGDNGDRFYLANLSATGGDRAARLNLIDAVQKKCKGRSIDWKIIDNLADRTLQPYSR